MLSSGFQITPNLINELSLGFLPDLLPVCAPCANAQKARHVHLVDFLHAPPILQKRVVGGIDKVVQRQAGIVSVAFAAFVGNSSSISVVWVCTAMSASAMSCIRRSTG